MTSPIRLIVGLGNPGSEYELTRHNAGAWYVSHLAEVLGVTLKMEPRFQGRVGVVDHLGKRGWLFLPTTFMNHNGQSVRAISQFYQLPADAILVVHDELDFPAGTLRLKTGGGHGGHNGLRDVTRHLQTDQYLRLRIGIGHPGHRDQVHDYVLSKPTQAQYTAITETFLRADAVLDHLWSGHIQTALQQLHTDV